MIISIGFHLSISLVLPSQPTSLPCLIRRIDANVSETQSNVEAAHTELLKYFKSVTSNRWLMVKIFLVVLVFFIIFIVFLA